MCMQTVFLIDNYNQFSYTHIQLEKVTVNVLFRRNDRRASREGFRLALFLFILKGKYGKIENNRENEGLWDRTLNSV